MDEASAPTKDTQVASTQEKDEEIRERDRSEPNASGSQFCATPCHIEVWTRCRLCIHGMMNAIGGAADAQAMVNSHSEYIEYRASVQNVGLDRFGSVDCKTVDERSEECDRGVHKRSEVSQISSSARVNVHEVPVERFGVKQREGIWGRQTLLRVW